jgi:hypothetical protein
MKKLFQTCLREGQRIGGGACALVALTVLLPGPARAQECRILSFTHDGVLTFSASATNLLCGIQYRMGVDAKYCWRNASAPGWNFTNTNAITTLRMWTSPPPSKQIFFRLLCSSNALPQEIVGKAYEVYGGTNFSTSEPEYWKKGEDPAAFGYVFLGSATNTATFAGSHKVYIIRTTCLNVAYVDTVQGSDGLYYGAGTSGDTAHLDYVGGPPDGLAAPIGGQTLAGGFIVIYATGANLSSLKVLIAQ